VATAVLHKHPQPTGIGAKNQCQLLGTAHVPEETRIEKAVCSTQ
jgi:hypothetical protein